MKTKQTLVKKQALLVSKRYRAGKFTRVSRDFLEQVEADLDAWIRATFRDIKTQDVLVTPVAKLFTGEAEALLHTIINYKVAAIVQNRIRQHPSIGKTLLG